MHTLWTYSVWRCIPTQLDAIYGDLPLAISYGHDMIIWGEKDDLSNCDAALDKSLQVTRKHGLCLVFDKIQYKREEISFYGDTYIVHCHKPAEEKKMAIAEMPRPTNVKELQSFLGVCNFLSKYSPRLAQLSDDLHQLTCKGIPFTWDMKHLCTSTMIL